LVDKEYATYKARVAEIKAQEQLEREVAEAVGAPDEAFEETTTETVTKADGSIVTTVTVVTAAGSKTTTHTIAGAVESSSSEVVGNVDESKEGDASSSVNSEDTSAGPETTSETSTKTDVALDGTKTETTKTTTENQAAAAATKEDGSAAAAPGQTKDMGLASPAEQAKTIKEEAEALLKEGAQAAGEWLKEGYKSYQKLNVQWKQDEDNVGLLLEVNTAK
jgi:hypothetical protein